jgi:hypothetical protein
MAKPVKTKTITSEDARVILGHMAKNMTDEEVEKLLSTLRLICNKAIDIPQEVINHAC